MAPNLGFIKKVDRTPDQESAHDDCMQKFIKFALPFKQLAKGEAMRLFDLWKHVDVVSDIGKVFSRSHQLTGSCVNSGGWNAVVTSLCSQRVATESPTLAFVPFTLHNYAMSRHYMGDDGQGEGSMGSTFAQSLREDGIRDWPTDRTDILPDYSYSEQDGFMVTSRDEMQWSSYRNRNVAEVVKVSKAHLFGSAAECKSVEDIQAMIQNGYGVTFACNNYIGDASIQGSGKEACVMGAWRNSGGHQQSIHAIWNHPQFGMLYWAQNNWDAGTYPADPAGGPVCGCWVTEKNVQAALRLDSEVFGLSHLDWFPAKPKLPEVLDWVM